MNAHVLARMYINKPVMRLMLIGLSTSFCMLRDDQIVAILMNAACVVVNIAVYLK